MAWPAVGFRELKSFALENFCHHCVLNESFHSLCYIVQVMRWLCCGGMKGCSRGREFLVWAEASLVLDRKVRCLMGCWVLTALAKPPEMTRGLDPQLLDNRGDTTRVWLWRKNVFHPRAAPSFVAVLVCDVCCLPVPLLILLSVTTSIACLFGSNFLVESRIDLRMLWCTGPAEIKECPA